MKEIVVTVDSKDKKIVVDYHVAVISRYVINHPDYDDMNYHVNKLARKELRKILDQANTEEGHKQLREYSKQIVEEKMKRDQHKQTSIFYSLY